MASASVDTKARTVANIEQVVVDKQGVLVAAAAEAVDNSGAAVVVATLVRDFAEAIPRIEAVEAQLADTVVVLDTKMKLSAPMFLHLKNPIFGKDWYKSTHCTLTKL